ncbi:MAG TPA: GNAT family N-acetyltransferase [Bryobacteraceae bacterium]|nr:GNAT family N-acetyltransferase [Bryobacteraceae bacterium]
MDTKLILSIPIETNRLTLDHWQSSDWIEFRPIATDPQVMRYITGGVPWTDEQIRNFVDRQITLFAARGFCRWKLLRKPDRKLAGFCGVGFWRDAPDPEIGWWLERESWGQGLATEAAQAALQHAFQATDHPRIISVARPENAASIRIMEKLGMKFDREFSSDGLQLVRYAIERSRWRTNESLQP